MSEHAKFEYVTDGLPPRDAQLWDVRKEGCLPTPLDEHGLVDLNELIKLGKATIEGEFDWSSREDVHHLQWPKAAYTDDKLYQEFRELRQRKVIVPRVFHNWVHFLTEEPPLPSDDIVAMCVRAGKTVHALASMAGLAVRISRMPNIPEQKREDRLNEALELYTTRIETIDSIPHEFHPVPAEELRVYTVDELLEVSRKLGKKAVHFMHDRRRNVRSGSVDV